MTAWREAASAQTGKIAAFSSSTMSPRYVPLGWSVDRFRTRAPCTEDRVFGLGALSALAGVSVGRFGHDRQRKQCRAGRGSGCCEQW
jgi:hypothetical protein